MKYEFKRAGKTTITLEGNFVEISRKGFMNFMNQQGVKGAKKISIDNISSIQFKAPGALTNGYLQFAMSGGLESTGGLLKAIGDENTVVFDKKEESMAREIKAYIEEMLSKKNNPVTITTTSNLDEIKKLKELLDIGAITEEEFEIKKKELL